MKMCTLNFFSYILPGKMEMDLNSNFAESRDVLRKQDRLDRVRYQMFLVQRSRILISGLKAVIKKKITGTQNFNF